MPSNPYDAKGLLKAAIRDDDPVIFMESEQMYGDKGEVPEGEYILPIGVADIKRTGNDVTVVSFGKIIKEAYKAATAFIVLMKNVKKKKIIILNFKFFISLCYWIILPQNDNSPITGSYTTSKDQLNFKLEIKFNKRLTIVYEDNNTIFVEEITKVNKTNLSIRNDKGMVYNYKAYKPLELNWWKKD